CRTHGAPHTRPPPASCRRPCFAAPRGRGDSAAPRPARVPCPRGGKALAGGRKATSFQLQNEPQRAGEALPGFAFAREVLSSCRSERVKTGATVVVRHAPLRAHESAGLEPAQGGVE